MFIKADGIQRGNANTATSASAAAVAEEATAEAAAAGDLYEGGRTLGPDDGSIAGTGVRLPRASERFDTH